MVGAAVTAMPIMCFSRSVRCAEAPADSSSSLVANSDIFMIDPLSLMISLIAPLTIRQSAPIAFRHAKSGRPIRCSATGFRAKVLLLARRQRRAGRRSKRSDQRRPTADSTAPRPALPQVVEGGILDKMSGIGRLAEERKNGRRPRQCIPRRPAAGKGPTASAKPIPGRPIRIPLSPLCQHVLRPGQVTGGPWCGLKTDRMSGIDGAGGGRKMPVWACFNREADRQNNCGRRSSALE